jgi:transcriptional regulator with XRE-family HTH domain
MNTSIIKRLRKVKEVLNLSLTDLSSEIGLSQSYLSELFWGKASPNFDFFYQMGKKYRVSCDWILHGEGNMFLDKAPVDPQEKFNAEREILKDVLTEILSDDVLLNQALFKMKVKKR